jgi:hypothetical protein
MEGRGEKMRRAAICVWALCGALAAQDEPPKEELQKLIQGRKVLVEIEWNLAGGWDDDTYKKMAKSIEEAGGKVLSKVGTGFLLIDFGKLEPDKAVAQVPHRMGALTFKDGALETAVQVPKDFPDRKFTFNPKGRSPGAFAKFTWGSGSKNVEDMERDIQKWTNDERVEAKVIRPGLAAVGNSNSMEVRPKGKTTLLEVFLITGRGFSYPEK